LETVRLTASRAAPHSEKARATDERAARARLAHRLIDVVDDRTLEVLERRRLRRQPKSRSWLVRRLLLVADLIGLVVAFLLALLVVGGANGFAEASTWIEFAIFVGSLPAWVVGAKLFRLYDRDELRTDHSTADELVRVFLLVTLGAFVMAIATGFMSEDVMLVLLFWILATLLITTGRICARAYCRRSIFYLQNTVIVGAGDVGQLIARKLLQHPEYGMNVVGFVDSEPKERRADLGNVRVVGAPEELPDIVRLLDVERVIVAFSRDSPEQTLEVVRSLRESWVQVEIVPRLFELVGPNVQVHTLEALPLVALPPVRLGPSSRMLKRTVDVIGAAVGLIVAAPLFAWIAWRIRRESPGPVLFRQTRLGQNMEPFTILKFRTMRAGTDDAAHREAIRSSMDPYSPRQEGDLYKADSNASVTRVGAWLRRTSLDELPQLINVLRGEMSLVGPRPSLPYEIEHFAAHHYERFLFRPGLTGLWQVTARAQSTWREALDMDVAYVRSWSLGLDLTLICRTPVQMIRLRTR
jgi:exopolysaccharide biosynthesis polyprenyl glycosylphosphotransferase